MRAHFTSFFLSHVTVYTSCLVVWSDDDDAASAPSHLGFFLGADVVTAAFFAAGLEEVVVVLVVVVSAVLVALTIYTHYDISNMKFKILDSFFQQ